MAAGRVRIGVMAFPGCFAAEIFGLADLLLMANRVAQQTGAAVDDVFDVRVVGRSDGPVVAAGGFPLIVTGWGAEIDLLVVPGFEMVPSDDVGAKLADWRAETACIAAAAADGVRVASVCVGAFLLAEAGVLDGREATTTWLFARQLADRYPTISVTADAIIVGDDVVSTTAGFSAVHDLAMRLVRDHLGEDVARRTARVALVADHRTSQAPYIDRTVVAGTSAVGTSVAGTAEPGFAASVRRHLTAHLAEPYDLAALAREFHVSTRTLLRRFAAECGQSPLDFLQAARVDAAKRLLESPSVSVSEVMERVGYRDAGSFRRLFADQVGVTPAAYRKRFRREAVSA